MSNESKSSTVEDSMASSTVAIPADFFDAYLASSSNLDELHVLLAFFRIQQSLEIVNADVDEEAFLTNELLNKSLTPTSSEQSASSRIIRGLNRAVVRGALTRRWNADQQRQHTYYTLSEFDQEHIAESDNIDSGESTEATTSIKRHAASVYATYEENIGILTPLIVDQIRMAVEIYPVDWIHDAIREAVNYNRRQWRYIQRILENWKTDGHGGQTMAEVNDEKHRRSAAGTLDTDQYGDGRYLERARDIQV
ncbi:DnaD domain protein [soil metagenome]